MIKVINEVDFSGFDDLRDFGTGWEDETLDNFIKKQIKEIYGETVSKISYRGSGAYIVYTDVPDEHFLVVYEPSNEDEGYFYSLKDPDVVQKKFQGKAVWFNKFTHK